MLASDSGSGQTRRGRGVTRLPDVTFGRVDGQRRHVDIDSRSEVDKNLLWQDIQGKRLVAQERQRLNDAPHLLSRGGYAKLKKKIRKCRADALGLESPDLAPAPARAIGLRDYFGPTQKNTQSMSQEELRQMDLQWEERLNQSMRSMEQRFMEQLQEQKEIQRALKEKLHSMTQGTMGPVETPTPPCVNTKGSCSAVEHTQYSGQYELLVDGDPPRIVVVERVLEVPVPTPEIHFEGKAIGSFIARPRALIMSHIATPQVHGHNRCRLRKLKTDLRTMLQGASRVDSLSSAKMELGSLIFLVEHYFGLV
ncbi:hypothetical protein LR48_Vigan08g027400 [Vigna angularis]|uniref:Uncharacterized protein n=1 Tax=Phaseolus angularis TaxID=3914 RepID=A0A0L9V3H5_PHAAN|nr:hypothetical protein LR48_Vigan08g027400 [Vigna angularis]